MESTADYLPAAFSSTQFFFNFKIVFTQNLLRVYSDTLSFTQPDSVLIQFLLNKLKEFPNKWFLLRIYSFFVSFTQHYSALTQFLLSFYKFSVVFDYQTLQRPTGWLRSSRER